MQPSARRFAVVSSGFQTRVRGIGADGPGAECIRVNIPRRMRGKIDAANILAAVI